LISSATGEVKLTKAETRRLQRERKRNDKVDQLNKDLRRPSKQSLSEKKDRKIASKQLATAQAFYSLKLRTQVRIQISYTCNIANFNLF
jgi:hypothetical protein